MGPVQLSTKYDLQVNFFTKDKHISVQPEEL